MLVLSRKQGESIVIGNDIVITVLEVRPDQIRIGIEAPRSVPVHRHEIYAEVVGENAQAIKSAGAAESLLRRPAPPGGQGAAPK